MMAFFDGGGSFDDIDKLKMAAIGREFGLDPLGYLHGTTAARDEVIELTSELLADAVKLTHPDMHPPERGDLARYTTQRLLALQPFTFPAPAPKPPPRNRQESAPAVTPPRRVRSNTDAEALRYPCAECASTVPLYYCDPCRRRFEQRIQTERDRQAERRRQQRARRKTGRRAACASCGVGFLGKRKDARFCSPACRQCAHRKSVTDKG
jgi:hypothetical protein